MKLVKCGIYQCFNLILFANLLILRFHWTPEEEKETSHPLYRKLESCFQVHEYALEDELHIQIAISDNNIISIAKELENHLELNILESLNL